MKIIRQKSQPTATDDLYSISDVRVGFNTAEERPEGRKVVWKLRLFVDLEPEGYRRERGFGSSYDRKKNACTLQIEGDEFERIQKALRQELQDAYQFLMDQKLLDAFRERHKEQSPPSEADLPDKKLSASGR